jgi:hypothetical protein
MRRPHRTPKASRNRLTCIDILHEVLWECGRVPASLFDAVARIDNWPFASSLPA